MKTGKVKWFNNAKGYGFILCDESEEDLFAHYSTIIMDGYRTLKAGQPVQFETRPSDKGTHAINIRAIDDNGDPVEHSGQSDSGNIANATSG